MLQRIRRTILKDAPLKLIALAIAVGIWLYGNSRLKEEVVIAVPLSISVPSDYMVVYQDRTRVQFRLRGPQYLTRRREVEAAQNYLKMTTALKPEDLDKEVVMLRVQPEWLNIPERELVQIKVFDVEPELVTVYVSKVVTRSLPVEVRISGTPRHGYEVRGSSAVPPEVDVTGPAIVLDDMEAIATQLVSVWDRRESRREEILLVLSSVFQPEGEVKVTVALEAKPARVAAYVEVGGKREEQRLEGVIINMLLPPQFPYVAEMEEPTVAVIVSGLPQDLTRVTPDLLTAYVDLRALQDEQIDPGGSGPYKEKVRLALPEGIPLDLERVEPDEVTVVLKNPAN